MTQNDNIQALHQFAFLCKTEPERGYLPLYVEYYMGLDDEPTIPKQKVMCKFGEDKYGNPDISILWDKDIEMLKKLNIYSGFNTHFQYFEFKDNTLIIQDDEMGLEYKVILYPVS